MSVRFTAREGLILHHVTYNDNGTVRPILYRASISELGSIYGDPRPPFHRKYSMDASQVGLGWLSDELISQEDCVGETTFFNVTVNNNFGDPVVIRKGICVTEEDAGMHPRFFMLMILIFLEKFYPFRRYFMETCRFSKQKIRHCSIASFGHQFYFYDRKL